MTCRHFRLVTFIKAWHSRSARPDKSSICIWYRGSPWPANTRSYPHLNRHIPHLSWFFPLPTQNTSFTLHLFVHNTLFESLLSLLTNHLGRALFCTSRRAYPRKHYYAPPFKTPRTAPIIQVAYCHPVLVTLSESFTLSVYDLTHEGLQLVHVLTSFTSFPPSSLVLTMPESQTYKLILTYASPVYPAHWSVGVTEVILSNAALHAPTSAFTSPTRRPSSLLLSTRSTRAFDIPAGWVDEAKLRVVREQWGRKVGSVAGTQTDGRWVVLAPAVQGEVRPPGGFTPASLPLQLYRLSSPPLRAGAGAAPKLTFVRNLLGQTGPVSALALADGRCVSLGVDGRVWVWDLENGWGTEAASSTNASSWSESGEDDPGPSTLRGTIAFDERRIISAGATGEVTVRDFDV
jgi:hypothetical protein